MTDLFEEKANDWDMRDHVKALSDAIGSAILSKIHFTETMNVMDFGAGTGLISSHIVAKVNKITAVDVSIAMLDQLVSKPELQGKVEAVCRDITVDPMNLQCDVIVSAMAMHHVKDTDNLIKVLGSHLKPDGQIALADLDTEDGNFHAENTKGVYHYGFDRQELKNLLEENGFKDIEFVTAHTIDKAGKPYTVFLLSATIDKIA